MPVIVFSNPQKVYLMNYKESNIEITVSGDFAKQAKRLAKKYPSFKKDYGKFLDSIKEDPLQGAEITKNIRKIRMAIASIF